MTFKHSEELWGRLCASIGAFVAYTMLLTFSSVYVPQDGGSSDIALGELPARALLGSLLRNGELPLWSPILGGGYPIGAGNLGEPIGTLVFAVFQPATALCLFVFILLQITSHGTYQLARRFGASPLGAAFAAIALANGGYFVTQLRHLGIISTYAWIPYALLFLDSALNSENHFSLRERIRSLVWFGLIVCEQSLCGFPQAVYISGLGYGLYALFMLGKLIKERHHRDAFILAGMSLIVVALGICGAAINLLPLNELASLSGRDSNFAWDWLHRSGYAIPNLWNFIIPYKYGDISDLTFTQPSIFWEVYGYCGVLTFFLFVAGIVLHVKKLRFWALLTIGVFAMMAVLGPNTEAFPYLWQIPGMNRFRFWTRFLVWTNVVMAIYAGCALTQIVNWLAKHYSKQNLKIAAPALAIGILTIDLSYNQARQNPFVPADRWISQPSSVNYLSTQKQVRIKSLEPARFWMIAYVTSPGWKDLSIYFRLLPSLPPNLPALYGIPSADIYGGAMLSYYSAIWGTHTQFSYFPPFTTPNADTLVLSTEAEKLLRLFGVTHVLAPIPVKGAPLKHVSAVTDTHLYEINNASRAFFAPNARTINSDEAAAELLRSPNFDPWNTLLIDSATPLPGKKSVTQTQSQLLSVMDVSSNEVSIDLSGLGTGYVFLSDTYFPGWVATIDGNEVPIARAHILGRGVAISEGDKRLSFKFSPPLYRLAGTISLLAITMLLSILWFARSRPLRGEAVSPCLDIIA